MTRPLCALAAAIAMGAAVPASAAAARLHVTPTVAARGTFVTFSGSGCIAGDTVFLISRLFPGHAYGVGAISTRARANGHFLRRFRIRLSTPRRRYGIIARCGGGNLGILVDVRVR